MSRHARPPAAGPIPERAEGLDFLGEERDSGYIEPTYLVRRPDGRVLQLSALLYLTLELLDGRTLDEVAAAVSQRIERELTAEGVAFLVEHKLAPLGLLGQAPAADHDAAVLTLAGRRTLPPPPRSSTPLPGCSGRCSGRSPLSWSSKRLPPGTTGCSDVTTCREASDRCSRNPEQALIVLAPDGGLDVLPRAWATRPMRRTAARVPGDRHGVVRRVAGFLHRRHRCLPVGPPRTAAHRSGRHLLQHGLPGGGARTARTFGWDLLVVAAILTHLEILQQLLPVVRLDGYFIVGDLVVSRTCSAGSGPSCWASCPVGRGHRGASRLAALGALVVAGWVLLVVPVLAVNVWILVSTGPELLRTTATTMDEQSRQLSTALHSYDVLDATVTALSMIALALPLLGLWVLGTRLAGRLQRERLSMRHAVPAPGRP